MDVELAGQFAIIIRADHFNGFLNDFLLPIVQTLEMSTKMLAGQKIVLEAFDAAVAMIKPGVPAGDVDALTRRMISQSDFGAEQSSRTAYSVGIGLPPDWGEGQILSM